MPEEQKINTEWNIIIAPSPDGSVSSRHLGLTLENAMAILRAVLADYKTEQTKPAEETAGVH